MDKMWVCDIKAIQQYCKNPNMKYYCTYQKEKEIKTVLSGNVNGKKCVPLFLPHFCFIINIININTIYF